MVLPVPVEAAFLRLRATDADARVVSGPARRDPRDARAIVAPAQQGPVGPLLVEWRALRRDGGVAGGRFGVGVGAPAPAPAGGGVVRGEAAPLPVIARLLALGGPLAALGLLVLAGGVVRPALRAGGVPVPGEGAARADGFRAAAERALAGRAAAWARTWWGALAAWALGVALLPAATLWALRAGPGDLGDLLTGTRLGTAVLVQAAAVVVAVVASAFLRGRPAWALAVPPVVALAAISASGHAAGGGDRTANVAIDLLHEVATAAWLGGLVGLAVLAVPAAWALGPADRVRLAAAVVVRFSALALTAVAILVVTGTYRALAELSAAELVGTGYGRALLVKLGVFAIMLVAGGYNRIVVHPRLERAALGLDPDDRGATAALRVSLRAELALALAVMVSVAVLVSLTPPA